MKYSYYAYTVDKKIKRGTIDADSVQMAEAAVLQKGFQRVLNVQGGRPRNTQKRIIGFSLFSVLDTDILDFSREFAALVDAGIPIIPALELLEKETSKNEMRIIISDIVSDLRANSLSQAISRYPKAFSTTYIAVMKTSEQTGELAKGLTYMAQHMEKQETINKKIRNALTYPIMVTLVAIGVGALLVTAVLPPIMGMFESLEIELPLITRLFVAVINFLINYKLHLLAAFFFIPIIIIGYIKVPHGRYNFDKYLLMVPLIGQVVLKTNLLFFCRTAAILLHAGVNISSVLTTCISTVGNTRVRAALADGEKELLKGRSFSQAMGKTGLFSSTSIAALVVGEQTGELDSALEHLAGYFERTSQEKVNYLVSMIEPALTLVIGLAVGFLAISIISPIYALPGGLP